MGVDVQRHRWSSTMSRGYVVVSGIIFGLIALAQFVRALNQVPVQVGGAGIPIWVSWLAGILIGGMALWAFASRK
jgi:hypothetical protein